MLIATGLRRSELLGLRWADYDQAAATISVTGKVSRVTGKGLVRFSETKTAAGARTLPLPRFAVDMLTARRTLPYLGEQLVIFPSTAGTLRDPNNFGRDWRMVRDSLGVPDVTSHSIPQVGRHPDRRRRPVGPGRRRPPGALQGVDDARPLHGPRPSAYRGSCIAGPHHKR